MDKEKNAFVESKAIKEINEAAEKAYMLKENKDGRYRTEYNRLAALIIDKISQENPKDIKIDDYQECAGYTFIECFKSWTPGNAGFWAFYKSILDKKKNGIYAENLDTLSRGAYRKMKKLARETPDLTEEQKAELSPDITREDIYYNSDENNPVKDVAGNDNTENAALQSDILKRHFDVLNNAVIVQKTKYQNSTKPCYAAYFYTEFVTKRIHKEHNPSIFEKAESGFMKVIDHDFVSYYMIGDNSSVAGISQGELKKVSTFTEDPSDDRPCGYDIKNIVYAKYISALKKCDKVQSDSSISQQRTKFENLIKLEMRQSFDND